MNVHPQSGDPVTGNTTSTEPENRRVFPALDGLRAFAFTLVFLMHYFRLSFGWSGVNLFFVLSGFLITGILLDSRRHKHRFRNFYVRRSLRIFPLYYAIWFVLLLLYPIVHWEWSRYWLAWPLYIGNFLRFLSPQAAVFNTPLEHAADGWLVIGRFPRAAIYLGPLWSLCVEEQFYLVWPWVVFRLRFRMLKAICIAVVFLLPVIRVILQADLPTWLIRQELLYRFTPLQLDSLLGGALLAILFREGFWLPLERISRALAPAMLLIAVVYVTVRLESFHLAAFRTFPYPAWKFSLGLAYINIFAGALIIACVSGKGLIHDFFNFSALRWIGKITYGAYVFHDLFHDVFAKAASVLASRFSISSEGTIALSALIAYPTTLLIAWLSFRLFEARFLDLKERFTDRASSRPMQPIAATLT